MDYYKTLPKQIFEKQLHLNSRQQFISMYMQYLRGSKTLSTELGELELKFDHIQEDDKFEVPSPYFTLFEMDDITFNELVVLFYFAYLVHRFDSNKVKLNLDLAVKRTGLSKTKIKDAIQQLSNHPMELITDGEKNHYIVPYH